MKHILALFGLLLASPALAQPTCPVGTPAGAVQCFPQAINPLATDVVAGTQQTGPSHANQTVKYSLQQITNGGFLGSFSTLGASGAASLLGGGTFTGTFAGNPTFSGVPVLSAGGTLSGNFAGNPTWTGTHIFDGASVTGSAPFSVPIDLSTVTVPTGVTRTQQAMAQDITNVINMGADATGAADSAAAFTAACTKASASGGAVFIPAGSYKLNSSITACTNANLTIYGAGQGQTQVTIAHAGVGIDIQLNSNAFRVMVNDIDFHTSATPTGAAAAVRVEIEPQGSSVARKQVTMQNIFCTSNGGTTAAGNFHSCVMLKNIWQPELTNVGMWTYTLASVDTPGIATVDINGVFAFVCHFCSLVNGDSLIYMSDYSEGMWVDKGYTVNSNYAVRMTTTGTLRAGFAGIGWNISNGDFTTNLGGFQLYKSNNNLITSNHIGCQQVGASTWIGYDYTGVNWSRHTNNLIGCNPAVTSTAISVAGTQGLQNSWNGEIYQNVDTLANFGASSVGNLVANLQFRNGGSFTDAGSGNSVRYLSEDFAHSVVELGSPSIFGVGDSAPLLEIPNVASSVVHWKMQSAATGGSASAQCVGPIGTDPNVTCIMQAQGNAGFRVNNTGSGGTNPGTVFRALPANANAQTRWPLVQATDGTTVLYTSDGVANATVQITGDGTGATVIGHPVGGVGAVSIEGNALTLAHVPTACGAAGTIIQDAVTHVVSICP